MNIKAKGTVTIPKTPRSLMGLIPWAKSVNLAIQQLRDRSWTAPSGGRRGGGGATSTACPFGKIISIDDATSFTKGIVGGAVMCGDKNYNVNYRGINTATTGDWLISLKLTGIKCNADDDEEIFLPGVETATGDPEYQATAWSESADYPSNTNPTTPSDTATIYVPLGRLTVADGSASFAAVGCGNITISQCAGTVSFTRG